VANSETHFDYTLTDSVMLSGTGNIIGYPRFIDAGDKDFRLSFNSDAIDAGDPDLDNDGLDYLVDTDDQDPDGTRLDLGCYPYYQSPLRLVEISPSNLSLAMDDSGAYSDWFKISNLSAAPINLNGYFLSDNPVKPYKYRIQQDLYVPAGDTIRFWANNRDDLVQYQVPFKLNGSGEAILISNPAGILMEEKVYPRVPVNYIIRTTESPENWVYSTWPAGEDAITCDSLSNDPVFSNSGGAITFPLTVSLTSPDPADSIYYSVDGGDPKQGVLYQTPLDIQDTTTIRSVILKQDHLAGYSQAATYFPPDKYHLPVFSLSTNVENLYGPAGIYTNYASEGPLWERPVSFSYYNDVQQFSAISGIRIQGGNSVFMPKKAFRLHFRGGYGTSVLKASPFDRGPTSFKNLVLRSGYDDDISTSTGTLLRDPFSDELWGKLGELATESDFGVLLLNNSYWGIYNIRESINEYFIEDNLGIQDFDMVRFQKWGPDLKYGTMEEWNRLVSYFDSTDFTRPEVYDQVSAFMDMNSLLNLLSLVHCSQFRSWTWGAFAIKPDGGRWRWAIWDTDRSYNTTSWNGFTEYANTSAEKWPNFIPQKLVQNERFRIDLINRNCDLLNSLFIPDSAIRRYDSLVAVLSPEMDAEFERWNPGNRGRWDQNNENIRNFLRQRPAEVYDQMKAYYGIDDTVRIKLKIEGHGSVKLNSLVIDQENWDGIYMTGVPITLEAWPDVGGRFIEWKGISNQHRIVVVPEPTLEIVAVFDSISSALRHPLVINEIMYNPTNAGQSEWIEIYNPNDFSITLNGYQFTDGGANNLFTFGENAVIDPLGYLVVAGNSEQFLYEFGFSSYLTGSFNNGETGFQLSNEGETLLLKNEHGDLEDYVSYDDKAPWPEEADGTGPSLQLISPELDNNLYSSWYAASRLQYSPGSPNGGNSIEAKDLQEEQYVHIYPIPMGELMYLDLDEMPGTKMRLTIFSLTGTRVNSALFYIEGGRQTISWQHRLENPGAYILRVDLEQPGNLIRLSRLFIYSGND